MLFGSQKTYTKNEATSWLIPNYWDGVAIVLVFAIIISIAFGAKHMLGRFEIGQTTTISLSPLELPYYALLTVLRMFIAMFFSVLFTFIFGTWAAKSRQAEKIIIPLIDILQSVPVLGFLTVTVTGFIVLFHGSLLGPECAAIFAIFTAQVWNMALSFYQSLRTVPSDLREASQVFQLSAWQHFWRIDVPFATPALLWNAMMSMSGSWVFLVAAEAISVANHNIKLPGIGSYIATAIELGNERAVIAVIIAMFIVIALYDQIIFRPLVAWAQKFEAEDSVSEREQQSWLLNLFQRTRFLRAIGEFVSLSCDALVNMHLPKSLTNHRRTAPNPLLWRFVSLCWNALILVMITGGMTVLIKYIVSEVHPIEIFHAFFLGLITGVRVIILIVISSIIWVPFGVWVGLHPKISRFVQPVAQFLAAFPANLVFPIVVVAIITFHLNVNIWISPLMILGTQWYILFNVIAGTVALPRNLHHVSGVLQIKGWLWWRRFILPGIFPYYITGAITAAGGAWNISIIAEAVRWGKTKLYATGIGAYIAQVSKTGDFPRLALGVLVMSIYVVVLNYSLWRPLYNLAERRFQVK